MARRIAAYILALIIATIASLIIGSTHTPANARDTGWDCPGCRTR